MDCQSYILRVKKHRLLHPHLPFQPWRAGSDCDEEFFSAAGGHSELPGNAKCYSVVGAIRAARSLNRIRHISALSRARGGGSGLQFKATGSKHDVRRVRNEDPTEGENVGDLSCAALTDAVLVELITKARKAAQSDFKSLRGVEIAHGDTWFHEPWTVDQASADEMVDEAELEVMSEPKAKNVVIAAVARMGSALRYAAPALKADREVVAAAVANDPQALSFAAPKLCKDVAFLLGCDKAVLKYANKAAAKEIGRAHV